MAREAERLIAEPGQTLSMWSELCAWYFHQSTERFPRYLPTTVIGLLWYSFRRDYTPLLAFTGIVLWLFSL